MQLATIKDKEEKHAKGMMDAQAVKVKLKLIFFTLVNAVSQWCYIFIFFYWYYTLIFILYLYFYIDIIFILILYFQTSLQSTQRFTLMWYDLIKILFNLKIWMVCWCSKSEKFKVLANKNLKSCRDLEDFWTQ